MDRGRRGTVIGSGDQPAQPQESVGKLGTVGLGLGVFGATGFLPVGQKRLWDHYIQGIRSVETGFPAAILRTFRISESLSPLETWSRINLEQKAIQSKSVYGQFLQRSLGEDVLKATITRSSKEVFGSVFDQTGKRIGVAAQIAAGTQRGEAIVDYYARLKGVHIEGTTSISEAALRARHHAEDVGISYRDWVDTLPYTEKQARIPLAARFRKEIDVFGKRIQLGPKMQEAVAKAEIFSTFARAKAATTVGRLNTLLTKPFEIPIVGDILHRIPLVRSMAVKPGPHTAMTAGYVKKGLMMGAAATGLFYYDHLRARGETDATIAGVSGGAVLGGLLTPRHGRPFSMRGGLAGAGIGLYTALAPRFDKGLFHGGMSLFTDANLLRAKASETLGLQESLRQQEEVTPGLHSLKTGVGFLAAGGMFAGAVSYGKLLQSAAKERISTGIPFEEAAENLRLSWYGKGKEHGAFGQWLHGPGGIGAKASKTPLIGKHIAKIKTPMMAGAAAGAAIWLGASTVLPILSGNLAAAIPGAGLLGTDKTADELQAIYSGEEEVPIKKGRWWEFGRCLAQDTEIITKFGNNIKACDIKIGDFLLVSDGSFCKTKAVFVRSFCGDILKFKTRASWVTETKLTGNHIVPVLRNNQIVEVEAAQLCLGDKVELPRPKLKELTTELISEDLIKTGLFLIYQNELLPAQKNWCSGNIQRSKGCSLPRVIGLTPELGRLFGYFLAEGNLSYKKETPYMIETVHAKSERWIVDDIVSICEKEFEITPTVRFEKGKKKTDEGCWIVRICSSLLARIFFELFYKSNRQQDKIFPQIFMSAPKDFKQQLVEGYWRGDGHIEGKIKVISSCRKNLLECVFWILLSLGEYPYLCKFEKNDYKGRHRLRWTPGVKPYFYDEYDGRLFALICSIEIEDYDGPVYDFEIDHPDHLFVAGTFLVHNSTGHEGGRIEYFRPHALRRLETRAYQKGIWGDEEERWAHEPLLHPLKAIFGSDDWKYHYEQKYQYERPAPLSRTYGQDIPFIGPFVAATFGRLLKPRKHIRPDEWMVGDGEFVHRPERPQEEPVYELGGLKPGAPVSPDSGEQLINRLLYRRRDAVGLTGYAERALQKRITGREGFFPDDVTMEVMGREAGPEYWLYKHINLGGAALTSEPVRRFITRVPGYLQTYNPLKNQMPSWIPDDYFIDLKHGNPFSRLPEAELRLPGPGYAALHPELEGVHPEDYPLLHRTKILGDVAVHSPQFRQHLEQAKSHKVHMSEREQRMLATVEEQVQQKQIRRNFDELRFRDEELAEMQLTVRGILGPGEILTKELGPTRVQLQGVGAVKDLDAAMHTAQQALLGRQITAIVPAVEGRRYDMVTAGPRMKAVTMIEEQDYGQWMARQGLTERADLTAEFEQLRYDTGDRLAGGMWESLTRAAETPVELLTPMSPAAKFIRKRSALDEYVQSEAVATGSAFWDRPLINFLAPALELAEYKIGDTEPSPVVQQRRAIQQYFDMLEWHKADQEASAAELDENWTEALAARQKRARTMFGLDPYKDPTVVMTTMPRRSRDFFQSFSDARTEEDRLKILSLASEQEQRVYMAQWMREHAVAIQAKQAAGVATQEDAVILNKILMARRSSGYEYDEAIEEQWLQETSGEVPFDEWLREKRSKQYFRTRSLPGPDWIGWSPAVDLDDVKAKYLSQHALDYHDYDVWGDRMRSLARKPYLNEQVVDQLTSPHELRREDSFSSGAMIKNAKHLRKSTKGGSPNITAMQIGMPGLSGYNINIQDERSALVDKTMKTIGA